MAPLEIGDIVAGSHIGKQVEMEIDAIAAGVARYRRLVREATERGDAGSLKAVERLLVHWYEPVRMAIRIEQKAIIAGKSGQRRGLYGPLILSLRADKLAVLALHSMLSRCLLEPNGDLVVRGFYAMGNAVIAEIHAEQLQKHDRVDWNRVVRRYKRMTPARINQFAKQVLCDPVWTRRGAVAAGSVLTKAVLESAFLEFDGKVVPAFEHFKKWHNNQKVGAIRLTNAGESVIEDGHAFRSELRPRFLPMVVEPYPWSPTHEGGYIKVRTPMIAKPTHEQRRALSSSKPRDLHEAMNAINATRWSVNKPVVEVMKWVWRDLGGGVGKLPKADKIPLPERPDGIDDHPMVLKAWKAEAHEIHGENARNAGWRAQFVQMLGVAERMSEFSSWYLPHQICFRGRFYPIPLHLNHHGNDLARSAMQFADPVPLTDRGRWWLKVHTANAYGFRGTFEARVASLEEIKSEVVRVARDPKGMLDFWSKADDPWQFLAACFALCDDDAGAVLPIQQDGSCNGMQHLCAAARDASGGLWVNLVPGQEPRDAYERVCRAVIEELTAMKTANASELLKYMDRKLVKQPVMTSNYNVTLRGMRNQIMDTLRERGVERQVAGGLALFAARTIRDSLDTVFSGSQQVMRWLEASAQAINDAYPNQTIKWTTPIGLLAVKPYRNHRVGRVKTALQEVSIIQESDDSPVARTKQRQGLPPNVVHGWDSSHMGYTAIEMQQRDHAFACVHDSGWSHASNSDTLNTVLRDKFVEMHQRDLVNLLGNEWDRSYPLATLPTPAAHGTLDLEDVRNSAYLFS